MNQYVHDNTDDERSHAAFINAFLVSIGAPPVNLELFRKWPGSTATGANPKRKRLTNLFELTIDTSYWTRYRARNRNPDLDPGFTFPQAVPGLTKGKFKAFPSPCRLSTWRPPPGHRQYGGIPFRFDRAGRQWAKISGSQ
jgi:hypothetical protein